MYCRKGDMNPCSTLPTLVLLVLLATASQGVNLDEFYPFGEQYGDNQLQNGISSWVNLSSPVHFFGEDHAGLYVNLEGILSFDRPVPKFAKQKKTKTFPLHRKIISPLYAKTSAHLDVLFRETTEKTLLTQATTEIHAYFPAETRFQASDLFIATWLKLHNPNTTINFFQLVLVSSKEKTFAIFHYEKLGQTEGSVFPQAGFSFGDERREHYLPGSGTKHFSLLSKASNVNRPGTWAYLIGSRQTDQQNVISADAHVTTNLNQRKHSTIENKGCYLIENFISYRNYPRRSVKKANQCNIVCGLVGFPVALFHYTNGCMCAEKDILSSSYRRWLNGKCNGKDLFIVYKTSDMMMSDEPTQNGLSDRRSCTGCSDNAKCGSPSHCCVCNEGFHGNGQYCLNSSESSHMVGNLTGRVNNIDITGIMISVYADVPSETTYVSLISASPSLGWLFRVMMPMVTTTGILFARSRPSLPNGFDMFGGTFVRRARVNFDSGEICHIREEVNGQDDNGYFRFTQRLTGEIPKFDEKASIEFDEYVHSYRLNRLGFLSGFFRISFSVNNVKYKMNVVEVFEFDQRERCLDVSNFKMAASDQKSSYEKYDQIVRFKLMAAMGDMDEKLCGRGNRRCHRNAKCTKKDGVEFCSCNNGFSGDGYQCSDVHECYLKIDNCSLNADCTNTVGSYVCTCHESYQGDGKICRHEEGVCGDEMQKCGPNSECVVSPSGKEKCECNIGFSLQGGTCKDVDECSLNVHDCSFNADCSNVPASYKCSCRSGYEGDGKTCRIAGEGSGNGCSSGGEQCGPNAECIEDSCQCISGYLADGEICVDADECKLGIHTCDKNAACSNTVGSFKCACKEGYSGDGYKCVFQEPNPNACNGVQCDVNAECVKSGKVPMCVCNRGFQGNGESCTDINECSEELDRCHIDAQCRNIPGSYSCECRPGYQGNGLQCDYIDPCKSLECGVYGECVVRRGSARCVCNTGYYGRAPICKDFNECESDRNQCDHNARCINVPGSYKCFCSPGYIGNGYHCESDGSCAGSKCHKNAECLEINATKNCQCKAGFVGSGLVCSDYDECKDPDVKCPEFSYCYNTYSSYQCRCMMGYQKDGDKCRSICSCLNGGTCFGQKCKCREGYTGDRCQWVGDEFLMFAQGSAIQRTSLPPRQETVGTLFDIPGNKTGLIVALDYDYANKYIYFTDVAGKTLWRVRFNGTGAEKIITTGLLSPEGIAVDYLAGNLYWTDSMLDRVEVAKLDGSNRKVLFKTRLINPRAIVVHPQRGTMYWADWNRAFPKIEVAHMDGGSRRIFLQKTFGLPNGLTIDKENNELCWSDAKHESISCANLDDGKPEIIYSAARYSFGLTSFGKYFIWTEWSRRTINWYDRQSSLLMPEIRSVKGSHGVFYGIKAVQEPQQVANHECTRDNGNCSNICLSRPGGISCACPTGFRLVDRDQTTVSGGPRVKPKGSGEHSGSGQVSGSGLTSGLGSGGLSSGEGSGGLSSGEGSGGLSSGEGSGGPTSSGKSSEDMGSGSDLSGSGSVASGPKSENNNRSSRTKQICVEDDKYNTLESLL